MVASQTMGCYFSILTALWQTEGWFSQDLQCNLAGNLGFLDFELRADNGQLSELD